MNGSRPTTYKAETGMPIDCFKVVMDVALIFLFVSIFPVIRSTTAAADDHQNCPISNCSDSGPVIQFPFRLQQDPHQCGHKEFEVFCSSNKTMMKLSSSSGFFYIKSIDYELGEFIVYDADDCLPKRLLNFTISSSLLDYRYFRYGNIDTYTLLNCSTTQNFSTNSYDYMPIRCLSVPDHHQVLAFPVTSRIDDLPLDVSQCRTLFTDFFLPVQPYYNLSTVLRLLWRLESLDVPSCQNCTGETERCQRNYMRNQMECHHFQSPTNTKKGTHQAKGTHLIAIGVAIGCSLLILGVVAAIFYYMKKSDRKEQILKHINIEKFLDDHKSHVPTRYSYADIKKMSNGFKSKLGEGGFGSVFQGKLPGNRVLVAVKVLKDSKGNGDDFVNEVGTIGRIHHVNVVRLLGFSAEAGKRALIYEHMPNSSLERFITSKDHSSDNTASFDWEKLHNIIIGIAKGIEYLHQGCDQRILHFDIKPHNILLDHAFNPKISDFGLAKLYSREESMVSMTAARGTIGYIAPEVFNGNFGIVSSKSDVYSFGMLVLEVIGARKETTQTPRNNGEYFPESIYKCLSQGEELDLELGDNGEAQIAKRLAIVALWCIQWYPVNRPSMKAVVRMLEGDSATLIMPPNPFASTSTQTNPATTTL